MSETASIDDLFGNATEDGAVSLETLQSIQIDDMGAAIQQGLGISVDDVQSSEVTLVGIMPDDSGSIRFAGNSENIQNGHNIVLEALAGSKQNDGILVFCRYLNGDILYPFCPVGQAARMDSKNYNPCHGTPLYDQTAVFLATMLAKYQEFSDNGVPCRTICLILSDGDDIHSEKQTAASNNKLVTDMLMGEDHIIAAMGVKDPKKPHLDFREIFGDMGIRDEWILTPGDSESEIRKAFQLFSQSAVRASQGGASFSQAAMGGFGS